MNELSYWLIISSLFKKEGRLFIWSVVPPVLQAFSYGSFVVWLNLQSIVGTHVTAEPVSIDSWKHCFPSVPKHNPALYNKLSVPS